MTQQVEVNVARGFFNTPMGPNSHKQHVAIPNDRRVNVKSPLTTLTPTCCLKSGSRLVAALIKVFGDSMTVFSILGLLYINMTSELFE